MQCINGLEKGLRDASNALSKHITGIANAAIRADAKKRKREDEAAVAEQQDRLKKSVKALQEAKDQAASKLPSFFTVPADTWSGARACLCTNPSDGS
eukprot:265116-Alexandrium_andersonii.AAC.1